MARHRTGPGDRPPTRYPSADMTRSDELFERAQTVIPGGVELARPRVRRRRRHAGVRRDRPRAHGSPTSTARSTSTSCSRGGRICSATRARRSWRPPTEAALKGHVVRRADRGRGRARRPARRRPAVPRDGAPRQQRHRGRDERDPAGARRHRPRQDPEVRGLLPRPLRLAAREGRRQRARDARHPGLGRRHRGRGPGHAQRAATTTSRPCGAAFDEWGNDIAVVVIEPVAANMGVVPPEDGFLGSPPRALHASTARCCCSTR